MLKVRQAQPEDSALILSFVRELAVYDHEPGAVLATEEDLRRDGFGKNPKFRALMAEWNGTPAGMALFYDHYSTWKGRKGIFIEDLVVRAGFRGKGVGKALMVELASIAVSEGYYGMRWEVLDWNEPAVEFYKSLGAEFRENGLTMQITGDGFKRLAESKQSR